MADTKTLFTQRFDAARAAWTDGDEPAAAESLRAAVIAARSDPSLRRELASALFNLGKLSRKLGPPGEAEAGTVLTEALAVSEELFGSEDANLAPLLHELSRLYVQQSQHARAEDALERLLAIARVKGQEHPDVAAALADLAFVKRKLGDDASAEALYRDALRIRERVLEPNHTVTIGTLERLSDTCAARGNFAGALAFLRRALPVREAMLGADHERVRAARSRVAELELQMAKAADTARAVRPAPLPRERAKTPMVTAAVAASLIVSSMPTPSAGQIVIPAPESAGPSGTATGRESGAYRDLVLADVGSAVVSHADVATSDAAIGDWRSVAPEPRKKRTGLYASAGAAAIAIAMAGLLMLRPRAASGRDPVAKATSAAQRTAAAGAPVGKVPATRIVSTAAGAAAMVAATHADSLHAATKTPAPIAAVIQKEQGAPTSAPPQVRLPHVEVHVDSMHMPSVPASPNVDVTFRSAVERRASDTDRAETRPVASPLTTAAVDNAHTSPKIIGRAPDPGFPEELLRAGRRDGQVVVRFMVNELGRVEVSTMVVEQSDDELFTAAVRDVLPLFRFEPAHTLGSDSKPVAVWVSVPFRFTTKKR